MIFQLPIPHHLTVHHTHTGTNHAKREEVGLIICKKMRSGWEKVWCFSFLSPTILHHTHTGTNHAKREEMGLIICKKMRSGWEKVLCFSFLHHMYIVHSYSTVQWDISSQKRGHGVKNLQRINFRLKVQIRCMGPAWQLSLSTFPIHTLGPFYRKEEMGLLICKKCFLDER